jgi:hypothetical protein
VITSGNPVSALAPGAFATIEAFHTVTAADMEAGKVINSAAATAFSSSGYQASATSNEVIVLGTFSPKITLVKSVDMNLYRSAGRILTYTIVVTNESQVPVHDITLEDPIVVFTSGNPTALLEPGESAIVTGIHIATQADMDAGMIVNVATASGYDPGGTPTHAVSNEVISYACPPEITVTKTVSETSFSKAGEILHYTISVRNTGEVTLQNITVTDPNAVFTDDPLIPLLAVGATVNLAATHTVTQADVGAGFVSNKASATGYSPSGLPANDTSNEVFVYAGGPQPLSHSQLILENYRLKNYPNPFRFETIIQFELPENGEVTLTVNDMNGRVVDKIEQRHFSQGINRVSWKSLTSLKGSYFIRLTYQGHSATTLIMIN